MKVGRLVSTRGRVWVVMPSQDADLLCIKPLDGAESETTAIYLPLNNRYHFDKIDDATFKEPSEEDIGSFERAKYLFEATRLSFRTGAGAFRSMARLSFRPRAYQIVPLVMALKLPTVRLLIADDVGIGKTLEALLIVKELLERGQIKGFAVLCLPHLCEQWQAELKDKFGIEAVIIRSNTQSILERDLDMQQSSVFKYYPFQVVSIDYAKTEKRKNQFLQDSPEMIILDEAHTAIRPKGASDSQQQRYSLISKIAEDTQKHLILLTATPHSGKQEEFQSLLGLLDKKFEFWDIPNASKEQKAELAKHFVQRRRDDIRKWLKEETIFPQRDSIELAYTLSKEYDVFYQKILLFVKELVKNSSEQNENRKRLQYFAALALLRGVMSSPLAGEQMLDNRIKKEASFEEIDTSFNPIQDQDFGNENDIEPIQSVQDAHFSPQQQNQLQELLDEIRSLKNIKKDRKLAQIKELLFDDWLKTHQPIIFCRYLNTAKYLYENLKDSLTTRYANLDIQLITSESPDQERKERIEKMGKSEKRLLIATDCLSEGINLQEYFNAVIHYDLPWNPNRLEQREGRVDRFGQTSPIIKTCLVYGKNNSIDAVILKVILSKVQEIKKQTGVVIPFPDDSKSVMDTLLNAVLFADKIDVQQLDLGFSEHGLHISKQLEEISQKQKSIRSIFQQHQINPQDIENDLQESDQAIGTPQNVASFVLETLKILGVQVEKRMKGFYLYHLRHLPYSLQSFFKESDFEKPYPVSFESPTPKNFHYWGRNHAFVEQLCQYLLADSLGDQSQYLKRAAVVRSKDVEKRSVIYMLRVRNVIQEKKQSPQIIAEEMILMAYQNSPEDELYLSFDEAKNLLDSLQISSEPDYEARKNHFRNEIENNLEQLRDVFDKLATQRAEKLVEAHERFQKVLDTGRYQIVKPVLPVDILGIYIILPDKSR